MMKTCSKCQVELHLEQFSKDKTRKDGLVNRCKACHKKYRKEHKNEIKEYQKEYYEEHKEDRKKYDKKYYEENKEDRKKYDKKYYEAHKEERKEHNKKYNEAHKEEIKEYSKKHYEAHKEERKEQSKKYYEAHKEEKNEYEKNRRKRDEGYRMLGNLRSRLHKALRGKTKSASTMELVGCSIEFLQEYLEGTKVEGKDYSDAHVDHIRPCASFDLTDPEQQRECFHYTNLQLLPALENISKGAKILLCV